MSINEVKAYIRENPEKRFIARPVSLFGFGVFEVTGESRAHLLICELSSEEAAAIAARRF